MVMSCPSVLLGTLFDNPLRIQLGPVLGSGTGYSRLFDPDAH
jgi:hypothetical protein